jgi:GxxExxY protein
MKNDLAEQIISAATEVHRILGGPGLLENVYESALCHELTLRKIGYQRQIPIPVLYKGKSIRSPLFLDVLVENQIIVEIKASEKDNPYFLTQLFTHLKLMGIASGLLINFGKEFLKDGISQLVNDPAR